MKKSMLLSTIAMIVVVVVALSTATFAWFSSFETVSSSAQVTVSAGSAGIEVREPSGQWGNSLTQTNSDGLSPVAPKADLAPFNAPDGQVYTDALGGRDEFFTAVKKPYQGTNKIWIGAAPQVGTNYIYKEFQVRNASSTPTDIVLTVTVKAQADNDTNKTTNDALDADKAAIDNTKIVVFAAKGVTATTPGTIAGNAFNFGMTGSPAYSVDEKFDTTNQGTPSDKVKTEAGNIKTNKVNFVSGTSNYSMVYSDNTTMAGVANNDAANWYTIGVYVWIDGHNADNVAAGAKLDINIVVTK